MTPLRKTNLRGLSGHRWEAKLFNIVDLEWQPVDKALYTLAVEEKEDFALTLTSDKKTINIPLHAFLNLRMAGNDNPVKVTF